MSKSNDSHIPYMIHIPYNKIATNTNRATIHRMTLKNKFTSSASSSSSSSTRWPCKTPFSQWRRLHTLLLKWVKILLPLFPSLKWPKHLQIHIKHQHKLLNIASINFDILPSRQDFAFIYIALNFVVGARVQLRKSTTWGSSATPPVMSVLFGAPEKRTEVC